MKVDVQTHGTVTLLVPHGPLTGNEVEDFRRHAQPALQRSGRVVLDFRDVSYLDSRGIETLLELCGDLRPSAARPKLAHVGETCREALDMTDVLKRLDVYDTVENAIRSFRR